MAFQVGQKAGDYEILGLLGKGGMGRVYRVRNTISDRIEAMKVVLEDASADSELTERFLGEIRTLARLDHPNIAKLHTACQIDNQLVMVMELVDGRTLADEASEHSISLPELLRYMDQVLAALGYAHQNGIVHRDIKPSNIMVTAQGTAKLMDFGIAKSNFTPALTQPGITVGSMLYMSPEQVRGGTVDARSDLYSLGIVLYHLSTGHCPFDGDSAHAIMDAQLNAAPPPPIKVNPSLPQPLNDIILTALEKDPAKRFQTAAAFRKALQSIMGTNTVPTQPASAMPAPQVAGAASQPRTGHRGLWMAAGALVCIGVLAAAIIGLPHLRKMSAASTPAAPPALSQSVPVTPQPQAVNTSATVPVQPVKTSRPSEPALPQPKPSETHISTAHQPAMQTAPVPPAAPPGTAPPQPPPVTQTGPSQEALNDASEALMKLNARADAVRGSLGRLRQQQAEAGYGIRPDIASVASRLDQYLQMAQRQLQAGNLDEAQKNIDRAEQELGKLEKFFGR